MTAGELAQTYETFYGEAERIAELQRAGLLRTDVEPSRIVPTRKGLLVAWIATRLR
jgi:hypothetical protein